MDTLEPKIAVITANLGGFDKIVDPIEQTVKFDFHRFTDENFPPRSRSMTPRLQARIPKMFAWQMVPGYDYYIWIDSSCTLAKKDSVEWFIDRCKDVDMVVFKHPNRNTIEEEVNYIKHRLKIGCPYITPRYENELADDALKEIKGNGRYVDDKLFASTAVVYKNNDRVHMMMRDWWYQTSRYHSVDQIGLPYAMWRNGCSFNVIPDNYMKTPHLKFIRK